MRKVYKTFILISLSLTLGCVGVVEDKKVKTTKTAEISDPKDSYPGLLTATPVSSTKVELSFLPGDGSVENFSYYIHINDSEVPVQIKGSSLVLDSKGHLNYTAKSLNAGTTYSFRITVFNSLTGSLTEISDALFATTFSNITSDFDGIVNARPLSGEQGKNAILVEWKPANYTGVSAFFPDVGDTVAYEVTYISGDEEIKNLNDENYYSPSKVSATLPASFGSSPFRSAESSRVILGLNPNTVYHFRVRAIHKGFVSYGESPNYQLEKNTKYFTTKTLQATGFYDFDSASVEALTPLGAEGLDKLNIRWSKATGDYNSYRIYRVAVADENVPDQLKAADIDALNLLVDYVLVDADISYEQIIGLLPYTWYQIKVVTCKTSLCSEDSRVVSNIIYKRVIPKIVAFDGITGINHPEDVTQMDKVKILFTPPVISTGYLNGFEMYCYEGENDSSPILMDPSVVISASGKPSCDGLRRMTLQPVTFLAYENFSEIEVDGMSFGNKYCFSIVPVITSTGYVYRDMDSATVKCIIPENKTPRIEEFPGKYPICTVGGTSLEISWPTPLSGLYTNFQVFWKESDGVSFKFSDAIAGAPGYSSVSAIASGVNSYTIPNLLPGKSYHSGVLTYLDDGTRYYSEFNAQTMSCKIPLPIASFEEWTQVFATGPKVDGMIPINALGEETFLFETLDDDIQGGVPLEVPIDSTDPQGQDIDPLYTLNRSSSTQFNGVYGSKNANILNDFNQYSNRGMIRFAWKDVLFYSGTVSMNDLITLYEGAAPLKKDRKFGYKVFRSDNNMITWIELTSSDYAFQTVLNAGPVRGTARSTRVRNNVAATSSDTIIFTDYSVVTSSSSASSDRARKYFYKVIPVFNGKDLAYEEGEAQHIISITLPPKNMALVHRMMANRTLCQEMGKSIDKAEGAYYSCGYNGVGSSSLTGPGVLGGTVYDLGSDLLVDRFELGCNYTRGNPSSSYAGLLEDFTDTNFKGCVGNGSVYNESSSSDPAINYRKVVTGDCFGTDQVSMSPSACTNNNVVHYKHAFPGARGGALDCTLANNNREDYNYKREQPQSEYAAVYYVRSEGYAQVSYKGANGANITHSPHYASGCFVNLHSIDSTDSNKITARWLPSNYLFDDRLNDSGTTNDFSLINETAAELLVNTNLYNTSDTKAPILNYTTIKRFNSSSKLGRIFSSNNSKLPPLRNLAQTDLDKLCSQYQVEVGFETAGVFYPVGAEKRKRIIRKKEQIVSSSWPDQAAYDETKISQIENGDSSSPYLKGAGTDSDGCSSNDRIGANGEETLITGDTIPTLFPYQVSSNLNDVLISGSSTFDGIGRNQNTQKCTSKFGIQDMVGNVTEYTADQFFCDFSGETLYLGVDGDVGASIIYTAPLKSSFPRFNIATLTAWVDSSPNTGSCSTVESGADRLGSYVSGSLFNSIYDSFGNANASMISKSKSFDQDSVKSVRNGDGSFLDFGQINLAPPLSLQNTLSLGSNFITDDNRRAKYFNPVLGMPLECLNNSCDNSADNLSIASSDQIANPALGLVPGSYLIADFPTNNAQIFNDGMREISLNNSITSPNFRGSSFDYIDDADPALIFPIVPDSRIDVKTADGATDNVTASRVSFKIERGRALYMLSGGRSGSQGNGRYSMLIRGESALAQVRWRYQDSSGRCVVSINEDD